MKRRGLLAGLGITLAAPAIVLTPGLLMSIKPVRIAAKRTRFVQVPDTMHITAHDLNQIWDTLNRRNGFAEYMAVQWVSREEMLQEYPMSQES